MNSTVSSTKIEFSINFINEKISIFLCLFGVFTNSLNIAVFTMSKMKDSSFKYMLATSVSDFFYSIFELVYFLILCDDCKLKTKYFSQIYKFLIDDYFTSSLAIFCILVDIVLSIQRYFILINKPFVQKSLHKWVLLFLFVIAIIYYLPVLFIKKIILVLNLTTNRNETVNEYDLVSNDIGKSLFGKITPIVLLLIRMLLSTVLLVFINFLNAFEFRKRFYSNDKSQFKYLNLFF